MFGKLRTKSLFKALPLALAFILFGSFVFGSFFRDVKAQLKGPVEFSSLQPDEIEERIVVNATIDANFGSYAERYEEDVETKETKTTDLYYVIWTGDENAEDWRYMGIRVDASEMDAMEAMAEETYEYGYALETIEYSGAIEKMSDEEYRYFKEYFEESGFTEEEIEAYTLPYCINVGFLVGGYAVLSYICAGIGAAFIFAGVLMIVLTVMNSCKAIKKELTTLNIPKEVVEDEYVNAKAFKGAGNIRIGKKVLFYIEGKKAHVAVCNQIVWAYVNPTAANCITLHTNTRKHIYVRINSHTAAQEVLKYINETMPWVVVGYNDEINRMYYSDYTGFLKLRYEDASQTF